MTVRHSICCLLATLLALLMCSLGVTAEATAVRGTHVAQTAPAAAASAVAKPKKKAKFAKPGKYKGHFYTDKGKRLETFTFRVTKNGRKLRKFRANLEVICSYYPPTVELHPMGFPATKIKKNHTFKKIWKPNKKSRIVLKGKFKGKRLIRGRISYLVGICVRTGGLKARRVGK